MSNSTKGYELEIWGGATAAYLSRFPRRHFRTLEAAKRYYKKVGTHLDELGVRAAHPMILRAGNGQDIALPQGGV